MNHVVKALIEAGMQSNNKAIYAWIEGKCLFQVFYSVVIACVQEPNWPTSLHRTATRAGTSISSTEELRSELYIAEYNAMGWLRKFKKVDIPTSDAPVQVVAELSAELESFNTLHQALLLVSCLCDDPHCRDLMASHMRFVNENPDMMSTT